jgi:hypothetical protein
MILSLRGQEIRSNRIPKSIEWIVTYRIAGVPNTHYCFSGGLKELIEWAADREDNATVVVKPVA